MAFGSVRQACISGRKLLLPPSLRLYTSNNFGLLVCLFLCYNIEVCFYANN